MADNTEKLTLLLSAVSAAGGWAAFLKSQSKGSSSGSGQLMLPPELLDMLSSWAQITSDIDGQASQILSAIQGLTLGGPTVLGYPANADVIDSGQVTLGLNGVALPSIVIPDNFAIVIKAFVANPAGSYVLVSGSKSGASGLSTSYPLSPGEAIAYKVKNASNIYVATTILPAWANFTVEQRSS
jgi:hypothetical protein